MGSIPTIHSTPLHQPSSSNGSGYETTNLVMVVRIHPRAPFLLRSSNG